MGEVHTRGIAPCPGCGRLKRELEWCCDHAFQYGVSPPGELTGLTAEGSAELGALLEGSREWRLLRATIEELSTLPRAIGNVGASFALLGQLETRWDAFAKTVTSRARADAHRFSQ